MRKLLLCLSAILCFSVECVDDDYTYFSYINNKWTQTDTTQRAIMNRRRQHEIMQAADLYTYLSGLEKRDILIMLNRMIDMQYNMSANQLSDAYNIQSRGDQSMINTLGSHIVTKGHYGYLLFPPRTAQRTENQGKTQTDRLELNEPRSYFNPSTRLQELAERYQEILRDRLRDLFFPGTVSLTGIEGSEAYDRVHVEAYNAIFNEMKTQAEYLILDVRNGQYVAEEMEYDPIKKTIIKIQ